MKKAAIWSFQKQLSLSPFSSCSRLCSRSCLHTRNQRLHTRNQLSPQLSFSRSKNRRSLSFSRSPGFSRFLCYPEYTRLLPCPPDNVPPRIEHLVVSEGGPVLEYICKVLDLPLQFVADLIHFGAVYYALVCPRPPPTATPEQMRVFKEVTAPSILKHKASIKGKTVREAHKTFCITHPDQFVETGTYSHVHPKRFPG